MNNTLVQGLLGLALCGLLSAPTAAQDKQPKKQSQAQQKKQGSKAGANPAKKGSQRAGRGGAEEAARKLRQREKEREREVAAHFEICDLDASGWVSYREAEVTLGISKSEFRLYDENQDGKIAPREFRDRYQTILGLLGAVRPPVRPESDIEIVEAEDGVLPEEIDPIETTSTPENTVPEVFPTPGDLLDIYDRDRNGGLAESELDALFRDIGGALSADVVSQQMDPDLSGELELSELGPLSMLVQHRGLRRDLAGHGFGQAA